MPEREPISNMPPWKKPPSFLERSPLFLLLLPSFLILHLEQQYHQLINYSYVRGEIIELFVAGIIIALLSFFIIRPARNAWLLAVLLMAIFYFFCDIKDSLHQLNKDSFIESYSFLLPLIAVMIVAVYLFLRKTRNSFHRTYFFLNLLLFIFIAVDILSIAFNSSHKANDLGDQQKKITNSYQPCDTCAKPDIYYLLFDGYTSSDVLNREFGYDNSGIERWLEGEGFFVVHHSRSNYNLTPFSLASEFNLQYLNKLNTTQDFYIKQYLPGVSTVYSSELIPVLEKEGYRPVNLSIFNFKNHRAIIPPYDLWDIRELYERHNIFRKIDYDIGWILRRRLPFQLGKNKLAESVKEKQRYIADTYARLQEEIKKSEQKPRFIYAHFIVPHLPFTYDSTGRPVPLPTRQATTEENKVQFVEHTAYSNKIMRELVQQIKSAPKPAIIIIQGDHGFRYYDQERKQLEFENFSAYYFFNHDYRHLSDSMTNINTFRVVLDNFMNQQLPLLNDSTFFLQYK